MSVAVLQGTSSRMLRLGAGHIAGTPLPGDTGNSGIAGHRDTFFRELKDIREKDEIQLQTATEIFHYEVDWVKVVDADDITVLEPSTFGSTLTLVTCYPFYYVGSAPKRLSCERTSINRRINDRSAESWPKFTIRVHTQRSELCQGVVNSL